ncbi:MAG TPA: sulfatase [Candidatus Sulfotelmatobacter sp.]|nr:sulfatase [Candidatus Sulfotelmatobacter sp.]
MFAQQSEEMEQSKQSRRSFLKTGTGALGSLAFAIGADQLETYAAENIAPGRQPNLVVFLGEGVRWDEFSCTGNSIIQTPNQDRIAREGITFRNAFATYALCAPSRASILTGLYTHTNGIVDNRMNQPIPRDIPLISDFLRQAGYEVAFLGKSHVKGGLRDRDWDYYFAFNGASTNYYNPVMWEGIAGQWSGPNTYEGYVDDLATDRALHWLDQKREKPFCLFLNFCAPHAPFYRPRRLLDLYNGVTIPKPATFDDDLKHPPYPGKPGAVAQARNKIGTTILGSDDPRTLEELVKDHYAGVVDNDENIGRVLQWLERTGRLDETAIILTSDHGFFLGEWRMYDKRFMHEPSIRVPLMVRYPAMVKAGAVCERMALNVDIAPTMLELAGIRVPPAVQGRSLVPLLKGESPDDWRKDWLYEYFEYPESQHVRPHRGVRTERYKLIHYHKLPQFPDLPEEFELYDLQNDPGELNNLHGQAGYDSLTRLLMDRIQTLRKETQDHTTDATA